MPIYEYACPKCGRVSSFLVRNTGAHKAPKCPHCGAKGLQRALSRFAAVGASRKSAGERPAGGADAFDGEESLPPMGANDAGGAEPDLAGMESLLGGVDENDPRSMGRAMRKLAEQTGEPLDPEMNEVVRRLESGEDPEKIEEKMGGAPGSEAGGGDELYEG